jgi:hypothetical protein
MARYRCRVCGGEYNDTQTDGGQYFHACPPIANPAYLAQFTVDFDGKLVPKGTVDPNIPEQIRRFDRRDENVMKDKTGKLVPKFDGLGREKLS